MREDEIRVRIGLDVVVDNEPHYSIRSGIQRIHVVHIVNAAHLLLDWRCHGLLDGLCIGADIRGDNLNLGRCNIGKEGHGKTGNGDRAYDHHQDGNYHRHDRAIDKEL